MNSDKNTHGLWEASAPAQAETSILAEDLHADVVIIGGGYTACSAALHLAEEGKSVVLLEAMEIGFGGAGRNVGLVNAGLWVMPDELPKALGEVYGERVLDQLGNGPALVYDIVDRYSIPCELKREGTLHCAVGKAGFNEIVQRAEQWQRRNADVELLDAAQARKFIGSSVYSGALLDRRAGTIQPLAYARGLARAATSVGTRVFTRTPAISAEDQGSAWRIGTDRGSVTAPFVIVATDAYASGLWTAVKQEQIMLPYFNLATAPLSRAVRSSILPGLQGCWDTKEVLSSFRLDDAGRLVFGSVGALRGTGAKIHREWGRRELHRLFPQLGAVDFEHEWFGWIGMTENAIPRFHRLARDVYSISGYNGRGISPGTTFGRDLARLALGQIGVGDLALPLTDPSTPSMRPLKEAFYEYGSQFVHFTGSRN